MIRRIVRQHFGHAKLCYQDALRFDPTTHGQVVTNFVIDLDGHVASAENVTPPDVAFTNAQASACVVRMFGTLLVPAPDGGQVNVVYPLVFSPSDE